MRYVQRGHHPNAYAVGGRSVAVTAGAVEHLLARRLSENEFTAVLVHELGHHAIRAPRAALVTAWLTAPWRLATRLVLQLARRLAGRQLRFPSAVAACAGVLLAVAQALSQQHWLTAGVLSSIATLAVLCPLSDATLARADERAADRYAADRGLALPLAAALLVLHSDRRALRGWSRLLASHPPVAQRIDALPAAPDRAPSGRPPRDVPRWSTATGTATRSAHR